RRHTRSKRDWSSDVCSSDLNDTAFKLARHYWKLKGEPERRKIISRKKAYHGVAAASTSATGIPQFWDMAGTFMPDFVHADTPYRSEERRVGKEGIVGRWGVC